MALIVLVGAAQAEDKPDVIPFTLGGTNFLTGTTNLTAGIPIVLDKRFERVNWVTTVENSQVASTNIANGFNTVLQAGWEVGPTTTNGVYITNWVSISATDFSPKANNGVWTQSFNPNGTNKTIVSTNIYIHGWSIFRIVRDINLTGGTVSNRNDYFIGHHPDD